MAGQSPHRLAYSIGLEGRTMGYGCGLGQDPTRRNDSPESSWQIGDVSRMLGVAPNLRLSRCEVTARRPMMVAGAGGPPRLAAATQVTPVAAQSCCTQAILMRKCQRSASSSRSELTMRTVRTRPPLTCDAPSSTCVHWRLSLAAAIITHLVTRSPRGLRSSWLLDLLIRRLCHEHPSPAHFTSDLRKRCSLVRSRWQL